VSAVAVTGLGVMAPHGDTPAALFDALMRGDSALAPIFPELPKPAIAATVPFDASRWFTKLQLRFSELLVYGLWAGALCLTGLALFYAWPTQVPPMVLPPTDFPGFAILQGVDAAGNACPSMHVAIAMFTALWVEHILREAGAPGWLRLVNALWFAAIAWSTLAVKQHVALDVVAGAALGIAFAWPSLHWRPGRGPRERGLSGYHEATVPAGRFGGRARRG
jgi:membrane-associated phospholipid phosphatase